MPDTCDISGDDTSSPSFPMKYASGSKPRPAPPQLLYFSLTDSASRELLLPQPVPSPSIHWDDAIGKPTTNMKPRPVGSVENHRSPTSSPRSVQLDPEPQPLRQSCGDEDLCESRTRSDPDHSINIGAPIQRQGTSSSPQRSPGLISTATVAPSSPAERPLSEANPVTEEHVPQTPIPRRSGDSDKLNISPPMLSPASVSSEFEHDSPPPNMIYDFHPTRRPPTTPVHEQNELAHVSFFVWDDDENESDLHSQLARVNAMVKKSFADLRISHRSRTTSSVALHRTQPRRPVIHTRVDHASIKSRGQTPSPTVPVNGTSALMIPSPRTRSNTAQTKASTTTVSFQPRVWPSRDRKPDARRTVTGYEDVVLMTMYEEHGSRPPESLSYPASLSSPTSPSPVSPISARSLSATAAPSPSSPNPTPCLVESTSSRLRGTSRVPSSAAVATPTISAEVQQRTPILPLHRTHGRKRGLSRLAGWMARTGKEEREKRSRSHSILASN